MSLNVKGTGSNTRDFVLLVEVSASCIMLLLIELEDKFFIQFENNANLLKNLLIPSKQNSKNFFRRKSISLSTITNHSNCLPI